MSENKLKKKKNNWSESEKQKLRSLYSNISISNIMKIINRSEDSIRNMAFRLKLKKYKNNKNEKYNWSESEDNILFNLHKIYGNNWRKISNILFEISIKNNIIRSESSIRNRLNRIKKNNLLNNYNQYEIRNTENITKLINIL